MTLSKFLHYETQCYELCIIKDCGWRVASFWIDDEDLFARHLSSELAKKEVIKHYWGEQMIVDQDGTKYYVPCHYIDV